MQYHPSEQELHESLAKPPQERFHYFLTRALEGEEIWSVGDSNGWLLNDSNGITTVCVWPYRELAVTYGSAGGSSRPLAVSLEHFVYKLLPIMIEQGIKINLFPTTLERGLVLEPQELLSIIESMMDSGEYYMEG